MNFSFLELALLEQKFNTENYQLQERQIMKPIQHTLCLSIFGFGLLISLCTFVFTLATVVLGSVYMFRLRKVM